MTIQQLFTDLRSLTSSEASSKAFESSGMVNKHQKLEYGFFPLGPGILSEQFNYDNYAISRRGTMILGNDFGTDDYLTNKCPENKELKSNPTIRNLTTKLNLDLDSTFFTNFYLGVRKEGTNTKRVTDLQGDYKELCYNFFITQLNIINPSTIICLGHEVRRALLTYNQKLFSKWGPHSVSLKQLYSGDNNAFQININDSNLGDRKFIVIPHPCDTRNFKEEYIQRVRPLLTRTT